MIREFKEYSPPLVERKAKPFAVLSSIKNNPLSWLGMVLMLCLFIAFAVYMPKHIEKKQRQELTNFLAVSHEIKQDLTDKKARMIGLLTSILGDSSEKTIKSYNDYFDSIAPTSHIDLPSLSDIEKTYAEAKAKHLADPENPKNKAVKADFIEILSLANRSLDKQLKTTRLASDEVKESLQEKLDRLEKLDNLMSSWTEEEKTVNRKNVSDKVFEILDIQNTKNMVAMSDGRIKIKLDLDSIMFKPEIKE